MANKTSRTRERTDETHIEASKILMMSTISSVSFKHMSVPHIGNCVSDRDRATLLLLLLLLLRAQDAKRLSRKLWMSQVSQLMRRIAKLLMTMGIIHLRCCRLLADSSLEMLSMARLLDLRVDLIQERGGGMARGDLVIRVRGLGSSRT